MRWRICPAISASARSTGSFPISITGSPSPLPAGSERLCRLDLPGEVTGFALLTALTALALLRALADGAALPDERLWRWMLPRAARAQTRSPEKQKTGRTHGL
jgi:hypothetical protein